MSDTDRCKKVYRRKHGYSFAKPIETEQERNDVMEKIKAKNALKAVVMKKRAFVEYDDRISYKNGVDSASEHLGKQVFALDTSWMDVLDEYESGMPSLIFGYDKDDLIVTTNPKHRRRNRAQLQILKTTSAEEMVESGMIEPSKYATVKKTQQDLGIVVQDDGMRSRIAENSCVEIAIQSLW